MTPLQLQRHHPAPAFSLLDPVGQPVLSHDTLFQQDQLLVFLHGSGCDDCLRIAQDLPSHCADWEKWNTALLVVVNGSDAFPDAPGRIACDPHGSARAAFGVAPDEYGWAIVDHRDRFMDGAAAPHPEPMDWHDLAVTAQWVAIQEPECGACEVLPGWGDLAGT